MNSDDREFVSVRITNSVTRNISDATVSVEDRGRLPLLYSLSRNWAWEAINFRCRTHPEEASADLIDARGDNILHWCAFGHPPINTIETILAVSPQLAAVKNKQGQTPLHVACSYRASPDIVAAIIESYPEAAGMADASGSCPLHLLCDYGCSTESLRSVLQTTAGSSTVLKADRAYQRRPLYILNARKNLYEFQRWLKDTRDVRLRQVAIRQKMCADMEQIQQLEEIVDAHRNLEFWQKISLLLYVEYYGCESIDDISDDQVLHAAVGVADCPPSLRELAIALNAHELLTPDKVGRLAIQVAIEQSRYDLVIEMLRLQPSVAQTRNRQGMLPLALAVRHFQCPSWEKGIGLLVELHPAALEEVELEDIFIPLVWSKISSVCALFNAVRSRPNVFACQ